MRCFCNIVGGKDALQQKASEAPPQGHSGENDQAEKQQCQDRGQPLTLLFLWLRRRKRPGRGGLADDVNRAVFREAVRNGGLGNALPHPRQNGLRVLR